MTVIRLNVDELIRRQKEKGWDEGMLAKQIGVGRTQLWRIRLSPDDPRYNGPGQLFIAGTLKAFPEASFEDLFFLDSKLRPRNIKPAQTNC